MEQKKIFQCFFLLFFFPVSLFCECYLKGPSQIYFNVNTNSRVILRGAGECGPSGCDRIRRLSGSLPMNLDLTLIGDSLFILGTPAEGTEGDYSLTFSVSSSRGGCPATQTLKVTVLAEGSPHPPIDIVGSQHETPLPTPKPLPEPIPFSLTPARAKSLLPINDYENIIRWKAPTGGPTIAGFRIYRDKDLTKLVKEVPIHERRKYRYVIRHRSPSKNYRYYLVSVSDEGKISPSVFVQIKGYNKKENKVKKNHQGCTCG